MLNPYLCTLRRLKGGLPRTAHTRAQHSLVQKSTHFLERHRIALSNPDVLLRTDVIVHQNIQCKRCHATSFGLTSSSGPRALNLSTLSGPGSSPAHSQLPSISRHLYRVSVRALGSITTRYTVRGHLTRVNIEHP